MRKENAVLVTGCNGGIGKSLCKAFRNANYLVIGTDIHESDKAYSDYYIPCDLREFVLDNDIQLDFLKSVLNILNNTQHHLSSLVNNAAYQTINPLGKLSVIEFNSSQQVNVIAPFILTSLFESELRIARGSVVNIGSVHAHLTKPDFCAYSTSKAGLSGLTRALALEFGGEVNVNVILPAATKTDMLLAGFQNSPEGYAKLEEYHPVGRIAEPEEVAQLALFLCSENARFITGAEIPIDGGIGSRLHDPT